MEQDRGYRRGLPRGISYGSGTASAVVTCQGLVDSHKIRRKEWSSVARYRGLLGSADPSAEVRQWSGLMTKPDSRRSSDGVFLQLKSEVKFSSRRSPDRVFLQPELGMRSGSRRSPDRVFLQPKLGMRSGSRRSPGRVYLQLELGAKSGSRRSPDEV